MNLRILTALGLLLGVVGCASTTRRVITNHDIAEVTRLSAEANAALVRGDIDRYLSLIKHAKDYSLMNPFGGTPTFGFEDTSERRAGMKQFFKSGTLQQEVVSTYGSGDFVVLVTIEHVRAKIQELPEQDWSLRVTQVYCRDGKGWELIRPCKRRKVIAEQASMSKSMIRSTRNGGEGRIRASAFSQNPDDASGPILGRHHPKNDHPWPIVQRKSLSSRVSLPYTPPIPPAPRGARISYGPRRVPKTRILDENREVGTGIGYTNLAQDA